MSVWVMSDFTNQPVWNSAAAYVSLGEAASAKRAAREAGGARSK